MPAVLPPALEALMRLERRQQPSPAEISMMRSQGQLNTHTLSPASIDLLRQAEQRRAANALQGYIRPEENPAYDREAALANADALLARRPGNIEHQLDLNRSGRFVRNLDAATDYGQRGITGAQYHDLAEIYPDKLTYPVGMTITGGNSLSHPTTRNVPDGRLSALTTMLSGLGSQDFSMPLPNMAQAPGYNPIRPEPEPYSTVMISPVSPGDPTKPVGHGSMRVPRGMEDQALAEILRQLGGQLPSAENIFKRQSQYLQGRQGRAQGQGDFMLGQGNFGISDPARYKQLLDERESSEAARRGVVNQRAMQVAQARTNRQSGMDPRTAALLAVLGDDADLGNVVLGNALSPGFGAKAYELGVEERIQDKANQAAIDEATIQAGGTPGDKRSGNAASNGEPEARAITAGKLADIEKANQSATSQEKAIREEASKIYDRHLTNGATPEYAASYTARELMDKHGVSRAEAERVAALFSGVPPLDIEPLTPKIGGPRNSPYTAEKTFAEDPVGWMTRWAVENTPLPNFLGYP